MLAMQMLWQHVRISQLSDMVSRESRVECFKGLSAALDSAVNTYRRLALAWKELRNPRPMQVFQGQQVNVAERQFVAGGSASGADDPEERTRSPR
jgi:hypothetical protein